MQTALWLICFYPYFKPIHKQTQKSQFCNELNGDIGNLKFTLADNRPIKFEKTIMAKIAKIEQEEPLEKTY